MTPDRGTERPLIQPLPVVSPVPQPSDEPVARPSEPSTEARQVTLPPSQPTIQDPPPSAPPTNNDPAAAPANPVIPDNPAASANPANPDNPAASANPTNPVASANPANPATPDTAVPGPAQPVVAPTTSQDPPKPVDPGATAKAGDRPTAKRTPPKRDPGRRKVPVASAASGVLLVESTPWSWATVGDETKETPSKFHLAPGTYQVTFHNEKNGLVKVETVTLEADGVEKIKERMDK
jgi:hypothetical protein